MALDIAAIFADGLEGKGNAPGLAVLDGLPQLQLGGIDHDAALGILRRLDRGIALAVEADRLHGTSQPLRRNIDHALGVDERLRHLGR